MSTKGEIKRYGDKPLHALLSEFGQIHKHDTFDQLNIGNLLKEAKREALNLITMIREKICRKIKGRACPDGRKGRRYINKSEVALPIIQLNSFIFSLMIDTGEGRDMITAGDVGAYILANMSDYVVVKITGKEVDIMCEMSKNMKIMWVLKAERECYIYASRRHYMGVFNRQYCDTTPSRTVYNRCTLR